MGTKNTTQLMRLLCLWLSFSLILQPVLSYELPDMGMAENRLLTPLEEKKMGQAFMRYIRASQAVIDDVLIEDYINQLGKQLLRHGQGADQNFYFFVIEDDSINAFAGPGGYIGVYSGLFLTTESENELAAVLAHEITHVTQRHLIRSWYANSQMGLIQGAAILAAIILGAAAGGDAAIAAVSGVQAALQQQQINFTRQNEKEADRLGMDMLYQSRFEPHAMAVFFERMGKANRLYSNQIPEFLRTHPVTNARIAEAMNRAEQYGYQQRQDSLRYLLTYADLKVRHFQNGEQAMTYYITALREGRYRHRLAAQYGMALAYAKNQQYSAALKLMAQLSQSHPDILELTIQSARLEMRLHKTDQAIKRLQQAQKRFPFNYPVHLTLAEAYLQGGQAQKSYQKLRQWLAAHRPDAKAYRLLARAAAQLDKMAESHEYMAEAYYIQGRLEQAANQLRIALRLPDLDFYQTARLEDRLKNIEQEIKALQEQKH